jgi:hypothetical protein
VNDAVEALQAKVGADSSAVTTSLDYKVADHASRITTLEGASGGKILQVVNAFHSTQVAVNSATYAATGLTATITPTAATSKVIVMITNPMRTWNNNIGSTNSGQALSKLYRNGSEVHYFYEFGYLDNASVARDMRGNATITFIDSPATTSATTYEHYIASSNANYTVYSCYLNLTASIILMEVGV